MKIEIAPRVFAELVARECFMTLVRLPDGRYEILNDLNWVADVYANNDDDAINQFENFRSGLL